MNTLTATITRKLARSQAGVAAARIAVAAIAVSETATAKHIGVQVNALAGAEGYLQVWARVSHLLQNKADATEGDIATCVLDLLSTGADDSWSGRGNDVARARFDGMRSAAQDTRYL